MMEMYYDISPYAYCGNNPTRYVDPSGENLFDVIGGFVNAIGSNLSMGLLGGAGVGATAGTGGLAAAPGVATTAVGAGMITQGALIIGNAVSDLVTGKGMMEAGGKYNDIPDPKNAGEGKKTTQSQRKKILEENKKQNNGELRSDGDGRLLNSPSKNVKGQKADMNQAEIDHVEPRSKGGTNSNSNMQVLSKEENLKKGIDK